MNRTFLSALSLFAAASISSVAQEPIASDDFSESALSKNWAAARGTWKIENGKLSGVEVKSEKHAAVLTYKAPHTDSKVKMSFQLNGSKEFHLSFNHPKGHLFRVAVSQTEVRLNTDKDKKDPTSKPIVLQKKAAKFEQGKTYTMTCETSGDTATVEFDNGVKLEGKHESLTKPKTGYRLIIKGDGVLFDNFAILSKK